MDQPPRPRVLYVDDQKGNLTVFRAGMRTIADVRTFVSPHEALEVLAGDEAFEIIISDQRMAEMTGAEFLRASRELRPHAMRMLMTAYSDFDDTVAAINDGQIHRYIRKPWQREEVAAILMNAAKLYWREEENRRLTEKLLHRERLAAVGQFTAGVVHELGNMMNKLTVWQEIEEFWGTGEDLEREFVIMRSGIEGLRVLLETLRLYSKGGKELVPNARSVDIAQVLRTWLVMLKMFPHVKDLEVLELDLPEGPLPAFVDPTMIEQVVVNLVKNGGEASGAGGRVVLGARARDDGGVRITVTDSGPGISDAHAARIGTGFFTTKGDQGTGLGLMLCMRIVRAHGGELTFENQDVGCRFTMDLPGAGGSDAG